nr:response regulator transcription factor [uncultured Sulfurimonas sp.]
MKIMLVEDEYLLNKTITNYLKSKNFNIESFHDGLEALDALSSGYDLFIIDIDIPSLNGVELLEQIRTHYPSLPVIMISATIEMRMIEKAYKLGCNDYLKKPFDIKELELKINAFTRDINTNIHLSNTLTYNINTKQLKQGAREIKLTPHEQKILQLLIQNRSGVVSNESIELSVWGIDSKSYLRQTISRLRKKLKEDIIQNHSGFGYSIK